jgi:hypothetical protein
MRTYERCNEKQKPTEAEREEAEAEVQESGARE